MNIFSSFKSEASFFQPFVYRLQRPGVAILFLVLCLLGGCAVPTTTDDETGFETSGIDPTEFVSLLPATDKTASPFILYTATDLHYLSPRLEEDDAALLHLLWDGDGKITHFSDEIIDAFFSEVLSQKPDALLLTGDLTFNGEKLSHEDLAQKLALLEEAGIPVLVLPGNHDVYSASARSFHGDEMLETPWVTAAEFEEIYADFGYREALDKDTSSSSYLYALKDDLWLLCINVNTADSFGALKEETLSFARKCLQAAKDHGAQVIAASHQTLLLHNMLFQNGMVMGNASFLADLYREYQVPLNLCGHMHVQHVREEDGLTDIATSALTVFPCQYGVLEIQPSDKAVPLFHYETRRTDVETWAKDIESTNPNLLRFSVYSESFYDLLTHQKLEAELKNRSLSPEEKERLIVESIELNKAFISGRLDLVTNLPEVLSDWQRLTKDSFWIVYLLSLAQDPASARNMNVWEVALP